MFTGPVFLSRNSMCFRRELILFFHRVIPLILDTGRKWSLLLKRRTNPVRKEDSSTVSGAEERNKFLGFQG